MIEIEDFERPPSTLAEKLEVFQLQLVELGYSPDFIKECRYISIQHHLEAARIGRKPIEQTMMVTGNHVLVMDFNELKIIESAGLALHRGQVKGVWNSYS